jgi:LuxR family maltose regulon positive regulatory protein
MSLPLVSTKFFIPPVRSDGVARPRLTSQIMEAVHTSGRLVLLSCPPGFGKTTLLSEFSGALESSPAWLSLDEGDNDPIRFWTALVTACQAIRPGLGGSLMALLEMSQFLPAETIPTLLINDMAGLEEDLVLILDDYHVIHEQSLHAGIGFLLGHLPSRLHIVVSTRMDPPWPLARLRARGQLMELRAADLRFTPDETSAFFKDTMNLELSPEEAAALEARTEGWAASLQLAAISMHGRSDRAAFIRAFTGSHAYLAEYLVEEVLRNQPEELHSFLLQTSILERLSADLCQAVTGVPEARELLAAVQHKNLFLVPLDEEGRWYRYHHLFADLLRARLGQSLPAEAIHELHLRAAGWYEAAGMQSEAIPHAVAAAAPEYAVRLVEKIALSMIMRAHFKTVEGWLLALPPEALRESPRAHMAFSWLYLLRRDPVKAEPHLNFLHTFFSTPQAVEADPALGGEWLSLQAMLLSAQGKSTESRDLAQQALRILPESEAQVRSLTYKGLADICQQIYDYEGAAAAYQAIVQEGHASGDFASEIFGLSCLGLMLLQQGKLGSAFEIASQALQRIEQTGAYSPFTATLYGELASIYYHWHRLGEARSNFSRSVELSLPGGFGDAEVYQHVFLSRLFQMEGDLHASLQEIEQALKGIQAAAPALVTEEVISQQVSILLAFGRLTEAQMALKPRGFDFEEGFSFPELSPGAGIPHALGLLYNSALRILLFRAAMGGEHQVLRRGIQMAGLLIAGALRCQHLPIVLQTLLLRARMYHALGNQQSSRADLIQALEWAAPEGFISLFLEEGEPLARLLKPLTGHALPGNIPADYLEKILERFPAGTSTEMAVAPEPPTREFGAGGLIEPLTAREMEVLRLIAAGDSNRDIAEKLVITLSAVKKHTGNIFRKLNVNSRTQALARARQLGLPRIDK